ncbi:MAG: D-alanine--D-alanine ligase family protein [Patescibacteria group bacterium]|jgi:D-alanine-D-alanine ligase
MNIGVFFGSSSPEHDVSIITGEFIISGLRKLGYDVTPVYLTKERKWLIGEELGHLKFFTDEKNDLKMIENKFEYLLDLSEAKGKMVFVKKGLFGKKIEIDLAFPAFHGAYGEDGTIQGIFELIGVPYVGCNVLSSSLTLDKALTKSVYESAGIKTTKYFSFLKTDWENKKSEILSQAKSELKFPVFVKPVHLGSSIGIAKVKNMEGDELEFAIEAGLYYDDKILIEEGVENLMDITCCVIGNSQLQSSEIQESVFGSELFDFEEKYLKDGGAQLGNAQEGIVIPARLDEKITSEIKELSQKIYKLFGCSGIARVDYLYNKDIEEYFANEVNTLPGTLYHHLWKASGIEFEELLKKLIGLAQEKFEERKKLNYVFDSVILKQLKSAKLGSKKLS